MSSSAKYIYLQKDHLLTLNDIQVYVDDYINTTKMDVQLIRVSRNAYMTLSMNAGGSWLVPLEAGKKYLYHLNTRSDIVPIVVAEELPNIPDGYVVLENIEFNENFEKIILGEEDNK